MSAAALEDAKGGRNHTTLRPIIYGVSLTNLRYDTFQKVESEQTNMDHALLVIAKELG